VYHSLDGLRILSNNIMAILDLAYFQASIVFFATALDCSGVSPARIEGNFLSDNVSVDGFLYELLGGGLITAVRGQEIDGLAGLRRFPSFVS
jgi:hypothetical protein